MQSKEFLFDTENLPNIFLFLERRHEMEKVFNKVVKCGKMWGNYDIFTPI